MEMLLLFGSMILFAVLGIPLVFSILGASVITLLMVRPEMPLVLVTQMFMNGMDQFLLLAIAFFFLAGELMNRGGITRRIVDFASALVGHFKGGLAQVNVLSSLFFSGISGSAVADTAAIGSVMIPSMKRKGYSAAFAAAITQCSSVVGPIIPPSIPIIIYAVLSEQSVGAMFLAGIVPGLLIGSCLMVAVAIIARRRDFESSPRMGVREITRTGSQAIVALLTPIIILGGILGGVMTATEAGAVACLYAFVTGAFYFRELDLRGFYDALVQAAQGTAMILVIVGASTLFAWIVADLRLSQAVGQAIFAVSDNPIVFLLLVNLFALVVGLFLDPLAALVILVPLLLPNAIELGISPVHFGIVMVFNLMIGLTTPPVGYLIYLSAHIAGERPEKVMRESLPFLVALFAALGLLTFVPLLTTFLPDLYAAKGQ
ncbi:TRAP transporter large permease [Pseudoruegeria sp. SK021]|uniref:TRAP transporter large permease n=1 Tax=Pseudoruegeria sp. SK021 TaxID=1933035 RepID=UPI000A22A050|nr:TRAP transporter large permease [Pseudoruegeria sp. SK021]OSP53796.1 C4-dicarboxylate ABC transporter permease [Pseudoruegeria sp. SK021]